MEIEKRKLATDEEREIENEIKSLQIKKLKLQVENLERNREIDIKLKEKELELKESQITMINLKYQLLQYSLSEKQTVTYVVDNIE